MAFEWDEQKSLSNQKKHGIDFATATCLWHDENRVEIRTTFPDAPQSILIAQLDDKLWVAVFTVRNDTIRLISVRRARKKEAALYAQKETR